MMTVQNSQSLDKSIWDSDQDLMQIKEIFGKGLSDSEFKILVQMGKATGLNPFLREIWAVKYGTSAAQIFIGRDGYRKSAQRSSFYDYHVTDAVYSQDEFVVVDGEVKHKYNLSNRGELVGAYCIVKRKGSSRASYVYVEIKEYNKKQSVWNEKPATMIKKVAEAQALKANFQELFAGSYSEFEQWESDENIQTQSKSKGVSRLKEKLGINEVIDAEVIDQRTGEFKAEENETIENNIKIIMEELSKANTQDKLHELIDLTNEWSASDMIKARKLYRERLKEIK